LGQVEIANLIGLDMDEFSGSAKLKTQFSAGQIARGRILATFV